MATIDILPFPDAAIPIETKMSDLNFTEDDLDPTILARQRDQLKSQMAEQNKEYCKKQAWWSCNTTQTQGACHLNPQSTCVAVGSESEPSSYFAQWLLVYGPIYKAMDDKTPRQRSLSVEPRAPAKVTLPPPPTPTKFYPLFNRQSKNP